MRWSLPLISFEGTSLMLFESNDNISRCTVQWTMKVSRGLLNYGTAPLEEQLLYGGTFCGPEKLNCQHNSPILLTGRENIIDGTLFQVPWVSPWWRFHCIHQPLKPRLYIWFIQQGSNAIGFHLIVRSLTSFFDWLIYFFIFSGLWRNVMLVSSTNLLAFTQSSLHMREQLTIWWTCWRKIRLACYLQLWALLLKAWLSYPGLSWTFLTFHSVVLQVSLHCRV